MKSNRSYLFLIVLAFLTCQSPQEKITTVWPEITKEMKPWTRWWWMGNAVNKKEIERQLKDLAEAGFGGVEITPIYGAKDFEEQYIDFLSDKWMEILEFTITKADEFGMGVDMNLGTGWPFGGPQITPDLAASRLIFEKYDLKAGAKLDQQIKVKDPKQNPEHVELLALMAFSRDGKIIDVSEYLDDEDNLIWAPMEDVEIVAAFNGKTRQKVKRAAPGGEGWSMDHFSEDALEVYLSRFDSAFSKISKRPRSFFNDSFEVYGSSSTKDIFVEFELRKGYDLKNHLLDLMSEGESEEVKRIKSDYREVFGALLMEEFTLLWADWSKGQGVMTRNQAHGSPANIIDLYAAVDIPECETFGSSYFPIPGLRRDSGDIRDVDPDPVMMKFATSAANVYGKPYVSSETFTWLAEHFKVSLSQCKPELEQVFLSGVNHVFYHGTTYSPEVAGWPGWLFYASVQFGPVNSFWPHVQGLNEYITRTQSILQGGIADNDVLVYWPIYDVWNDSGRLDKQVSIHNIDGWLHPTSFYQLSKGLMEEGYLIDFATDKMLGEISVQEGLLNINNTGGSYKTLIIPSCQYMPLQTLRNIRKLAKEGATIVFENLPIDVPGYENLKERKKQFAKILKEIEEKDTENGKLLPQANVKVALDRMGIVGESLLDTGLKFVRRNINGERYYYLVNHTPRTIDENITLNSSSNAVILMDPDHESFGYVKPEKVGEYSKVRIHLESGKTIILRCTDKAVSTIPKWKYASDAQEYDDLSGPWTLTFTSGGPELPANVELEKLVSWTELEDERGEYFSGTGVYEYTLDLEGALADDYILDLGRVAESARILINDKEVDVLWSLPFKIKIGEYLSVGENKIKIEVANLMANRVRYMDQQGQEWRKFHEINFVNIDYAPFDASGWEPMPSGLLGPVTLSAVKLE